MSALDDAAITWLRQHHSTISAAALAASDVTIDQRDALVRAGLLVRIVDGAYGLGGVEVDELARCAALCTSRPDLVIAGPTAGRIWQLRRSPRDGLVHVIAAPGSHPCREPWVRAYRTALIEDVEIVRRRDGIRLTSPPRTAVDLTRYVDGHALQSIIEHVLSAGYCTDTTLFRTAERINTPGRPWVRKFLRTLAARQPGAPAESDGELRVWRALLRHGVHDLVRQFAVVLPGYGPARFDLAVPEIKWDLEVDLHPEHRTPEGVARDNHRDAAATSRGWLVRRLGEVELARSTFDDTIHGVVAEIDERRRHVEQLARAGLWVRDER